MKKQILVSIFAAIFIACLVRAETSVTTSVLSEYVNSTSAVFSNKAVIQTVASQDLPYGTYGALFCSTGVDHQPSNQSYADEIDYTAGWRGGKKIQFDVSISYWDLYGVFSGNRRDVVALTMNASHSIPIGDVKTAVAITFEKYIPTDPSFWSPGCRGTLSYSAKVPFSKKIVVSSKFAFVHDDGSLSGQPISTAVVSINVVWMTKNFTVLFPQVKAVTLLNSVKGRVDHFVYGIGVSRVF